jgi:hypothetical protein
MIRDLAERALSRRERKWERMTQAQRNRRTIISSTGKIVLLFMIGVALIYGVIAAITNSSLFVPQSASGVLQSVPNVPVQSFNDEMERRVTLAGSTFTYEAVRSAQVDVADNKFEADVEGVLPTETKYASDGHYTISLSGNSSSNTQNWQYALNPCDTPSAVPASDIEMPSPQELLRMDPSIVSTQATVQGAQAWLLSFKPTDQLISQLLWLKFFKTVADAPGDFAWVISNRDLEAIIDGTIHVKWALAYVTRGSRELSQIDVEFTVPGGSEYRILVRADQSSTAQITKLNLGQYDCSKTTTSSAGTTVPNVSTVP